MKEAVSIAFYNGKTPSQTLVEFSGLGTRTRLGIRYRFTCSFASYNKGEKNNYISSLWWSIFSVKALHESVLVINI